MSVSLVKARRVKRRELKRGREREIERERESVMNSAPPKRQFLPRTQLL